MTKRFYHGLIVCLCLFVLSNCATYRKQTVDPTPIDEAQVEIAEENLIDVGIVVFESVELTEQKAKKQGTHPDIRKAECHFIAYHLKNTLQQSSHWGAVRVIPNEAPGVDLLVRGEVVESNGERLVLKVDVVDAGGSTWVHTVYQAEATQDFYTDNLLGEKDAFQDLYNSVANDMVAYKEELRPAEIREIRTISTLRFAADFAPDPFDSYLARDRKDRVKINRLPADDDSMMERLLKIRDRDHMYVDTLNEYYGEFYNEMWPPYESWRKNNLIEQTALREIRREAFLKKMTGALLIAGAIALGAADVNVSDVLRDLMVITGGVVIVNGINVSREAEIHQEAIQELSESFGSEMKPVVMEFEGEQYELSGSAEEQYRRWRELLREIYYAETGFDQPDGSETESSPDE